MADVHPDAAIEELSKCKTASHLRVIPVQVGDAHDVEDQEVRRIEDIRCKNHTDYRGWGAVIAPKSKNDGMQLLPDAVEFLAVQLPIVADEARDATDGRRSVALQHRVAGKMKTWRSFTPNAADAVGLALEAEL